jgi:hypothetical protein
MYGEYSAPTDRISPNHVSLPSLHTCFCVVYAWQAFHWLIRVWAMVWLTRSPDLNLADFFMVGHCSEVKSQDALCQVVQATRVIPGGQ